MDQKPTITVSGPAGCGKLMIAKFIQEKLLELGLQSVVNDYDLGKPIEPSTDTTIHINTVFTRLAPGTKEFSEEQYGKEG